MGACSGGPYGERNTRSVSDCHDLCPLSFLSFSNIKPPFLALAKVPSIKHSVMSIFPRSFRSFAIPQRTLSQTPTCTQFWKYRWQVWYGGYLSGISFHWALVLQIQIIPLSTWRLSCGGLPFLPGKLFDFGSRWEIISHCLLLTSMFYSRNSTWTKPKNQTSNIITKN